MTHPVVFLSSSHGKQVKDRSGLVGKYVYSTYWRSWDYVIAEDDGEVTVQEVNLDGKPIGGIRTHRTSIPEGSVFDVPFDPYA